TGLPRPRCGGGAACPRAQPRGGFRRLYRVCGSLFRHFRSARGRHCPSTGLSPYLPVRCRHGRLEHGDTADPLPEAGGAAPGAATRSHEGEEWMERLLLLVRKRGGQGGRVRMFCVSRHSPVTTVATTAQEKTLDRPLNAVSRP